MFTIQVTTVSESNCFISPSDFTLITKCSQVTTVSESNCFISPSDFTLITKCSQVTTVSESNCFISPSDFTLITKCSQYKLQLYQNRTASYLHQILLWLQNVHDTTASESNCFISRSDFTLITKCSRYNCIRFELLHISRFNSDYKMFMIQLYQNRTASYLHQTLLWSSFVSYWLCDSQPSQGHWKWYGKRWYRLTELTSMAGTKDFKEKSCKQGQKWNLPCKTDRESSSQPARLESLHRSVFLIYSCG